MRESYFYFPPVGPTPPDSSGLPIWAIVLIIICCLGSLWPIIRIGWPFLVKKLWPIVQEVCPFLVKKLWPIVQEVRGFLVKKLWPIIQEVRRFLVNKLWSIVRKAWGLLVKKNTTATPRTPRVLKDEVPDKEPVNEPMTTDDVIPDVSRTNDDCSICLQEMQPLKTLPCGHRMHEDCADIWVRQRGTCPLCRHPVVSGWHNWINLDSVDYNLKLRINCRRRS